MSRWEYDVTFYRVFCVMLLAIAFIFTVILTNVFIDIDGLLLTKEKDHNLLIKSIIEIWNEDKKQKKDIISNKNVKGLVQLNYNEKPVNFTQLDDAKLYSMETNKTIYDIEQYNSERVTNYQVIPPDFKNTYKKYDKTIINSHINKVLKELLANYNITNKYKNDSETIYHQSKRLKRQANTDNEVTTLKHKSIHHNSKRNDADLYVEIETNFDANGVRDEKKKKFVKNIISKIQKALHSDIEQTKESQEKRFKYKKRIQGPIIVKKPTFSDNQVKSPLETIEKRQVGPINKILKGQDNILYNTDNIDFGSHKSPTFLTVSKSGNSAEQGKVGVNFDEVLNNGIPKRLQLPLTGSNSEDYDIPQNILSNLGNVTLMLKDIIGTGFSIGFNQYVNEAPDNESLKIFSGLENLIKEYHKTYDGVEASNEIDNNNSKSYIQNIHELTKRDTKVYNVEPQSHKDMLVQMKKHYYHKLNFKNKISEINQNKPLLDYLNPYSKYVKLNEPIIIKEKILKKTFVPTEFFSLPSIVSRRKRSISLHKISNMKSKIKLNKYINTDSMSKKKIFLKNKRNKRQLNLIRFLSKDQPLHFCNDSDESLFLISREDTICNRASLIKQSKFPDVFIDKGEESYIAPNAHIDNIQLSGNQHLHKKSKSDDVSDPNNLMSKYPHLIWDKLPMTYNGESSDENIRYGNSYRIRSSPKYQNIVPMLETATIAEDLNSHGYAQSIEEFVNAVIPKTRFKVTVNILPKNNSTNDMNTCFTEIYTSVNKSYAKDSLHYITLLNISKLSKVEKLNQTKSDMENDNQWTSILKAYKNKIDQQLNKLIIERKDLDGLINDYKKNESYEMLNKIQSNMIANDLNFINSMKVKTPQISHSISIKEPPINTTDRPSKLTTNPSILNDSNDKSLLLRTINRNENITNEILKKIDKNTNIMQNFIQKLSEHLDSVKKQNADMLKKSTNRVVIKPIPKIFQDNTGQKLKQSDTVTNKINSNVVNSTFIVPYTSKNNMKMITKQLPMASVLYKGELFANTLDKIGEPNHLDFLVKRVNDRIKRNETKFFLDKYNKNDKFEKY